MGTQSEFYVFIDKSVYKGEYFEIKGELKNVFIQIGLDLGWKLKSSNDVEIIFTTPFTLRSIGETVTVNYNSYRIDVKSVANQKTVLTTWGKNDDNCKKYLDKVLESVKKYLLAKEDNRQSENLKLLSQVRLEIKELKSNKDLFRVIQENQGKIDKSLIPNFIKIFQYYEEQVNTHNLIFQNINDLNFHKLHSRSIESSIEAIKIYTYTIQVLEVTIKELFSSYITEDLINFYTLYNQFENMGLFLTKGEKMIVKGLSDINENIDSLVAGIDTLTDSIYDMGKTLNEINAGVDISNLLSVVNTYQLYRIQNN